MTNDNYDPADPQKGKGVQPSAEDAAARAQKMDAALTPKEIESAIANRIMQAYQDHEDPHDAAHGIVEAIQNTGCTICPDGGTVGMVRALIRGLGIEDADASLSSFAFRKHIEPLKRAIFSSPLRIKAEAHNDDQ